MFEYFMTKVYMNIWQYSMQIFGWPSSTQDINIRIEESTKNICEATKPAICEAKNIFVVKQV